MATAAHESGASPPAHAGASSEAVLAGRERLIQWSLRAFIALDLVLLTGYAVAVGGYRVGALDGSPNFPLITNSVGLYVLLLCSAALALADVRRFRAMLLLISGTHAVQVTCLVFMVALHGVSGDVSILQLVDVPAAAVFASWMVYALVFMSYVVLYVARGIEDEADFSFVAASVSKDALFLALGVLALSRPARWASLTLVVVVGHFALVASNSLLWGSVSGPAPVFGSDPPLGGDGVDVVRNWVLADVGVNVLLVAVLWLYQRARYRLDYLWPPAVRALEAFADALFENVPAKVSPRSVAETV